MLCNLGLVEDSVDVSMIASMIANEQPVEEGIVTVMMLLLRFIVAIFIVSRFVKM